MLLPVQVTFHGLAPSEALRGLVNDEAAKLEHLYRDVISCRVAVERLSGQHRHGNPYRVRIDLAVPGKRLVVDSQPATHRALDSIANIFTMKSDEVRPQHKDATLATRDAFRKLSRRLQDYARRQRGDVKIHEETQREGQVTRLFTDLDYGFLTTPDGREVYFNRASVLDEGFERPAIGARVRFVEEVGEKGPQASTVRLV
jgi:cold shock CspA family protein/ribosome-associated translation inhibitor RaiA